jgi:hypothetical protein
MKKLFLLSVAIFLVACASVKFDSSEYSAFVGVRVLADQIHKKCNSPQEASLLVAQMEATSQYAVVYTQHKAGREDVYNAAKELYGMTSEMRARYSQAAVPTKAYCEEKAANIARGADLILTTTGKMQ